MCIYTYYIYIYIYTGIYVTYVYIHLSLYIYIYMYIYVCTCIDIWIGLLGSRHIILSFLALVMLGFWPVFSVYVSISYTQFFKMSYVQFVSLCNNLLGKIQAAPHLSAEEDCVPPIQRQHGLPRAHIDGQDLM